MRFFRIARWLLPTLLLSLIPASSHAQLLISVNFAPPELPVYEQPMCPEPNLMWVPGYWAYSQNDGDYYWVPGTWVAAPYEGALWTPDYWDWYGGHYRFHRGYWGRHVGYYGGVDYGYGYGGIGFSGGEWRGNEFAYNTAVTHVNENVIHTTYNDRTIVEQNTIANNNHVSYNGGPGGIQHKASASELVAAHDKHTAPTSVQTQHMAAARSNKTSFAKANGGHPKTTVVAKPLTAQQHAAPKAETRTTPKAEARTAPKAEGRTAPKAEARTAPKAETRTAPKAEGRTAPKAEGRTAPKAEARTAPKAETRTAPKAETRTAPKAETRTAPKAETRTAPKAEARTAPRAESHAAPRQQQAAPQEESKPKGR